MENLLEMECEEIQNQFSGRDYSDKGLEASTQAQLTVKPVDKQTSIAMDRDLCIKAIEQDLRITDIVKEKLEQTIKTKKLIKKINTKPQFQYPFFEETPLPSPPEKEAFEKVEYTFAYTIRDNVGGMVERNLFLKIFKAIGNALIFLALYFILSKGIAPKYESTSNSAYLWIEGVSWLSLILMAISLFSVGAFGITPLLTYLLALCCSAVCFIPLLFYNIVKRKAHTQHWEKIIAEYSTRKDQIEQRNQRDKKIYQEERANAENEFETDWNNGAEERKSKTEKLEKIYLGQYKEVLAYQKLLKYIKENVFTIPKDYDDELHKKEILAHLKNYKAVTFSEAIRYIETLAMRKEEIELKKQYYAQMLEIERKKAQNQQQRYKEASLAEQRNLQLQKELLETQKHQAAEEKKHTEMLEKHTEILEKLKDKVESLPQEEKSYYYSSYDPNCLTEMDIERAVYNALK